MINENQVVVCQWPDGRAVRTVPSAEFLAQVRAGKRTPESLRGPFDGKTLGEGWGAPHAVVNKADMPQDDTFMEAWEWDPASANRIRHNMVKARDVIRQFIRGRRPPILQKLDAVSVRAIENGQPIPPAVLAAKQALRDAPSDPRIVAATNIPELKAALQAIAAEIQAIDDAA